MIDQRLMITSRVVKHAVGRFDDASGYADRAGWAIQDHRVDGEQLGAAYSDVSHFIVR